METYQLEKYLLPVWEGDTVYHETVLFLGEEDFAPLLYPATEIVSVYDYGLQIEYVEGKDYQLVNGGIKRIKGGKTPFMAIDDYYLTEPAQFAISIVNRNEKAPEGKKYFSFGEKDSYSKYQIAVTYKHNAKKSIEIPQTKKERFKNFNDKIKNSKPVTIVFYGDSITMGCNTSGTPMGGETPPYMDKFSVMIAKKIQSKYSVPVKHINVAVGGWSSVNGLENFESKVLSTPADLMVLGFGMNDGRTELDLFHDNVEKMVKSFRENNPNGEVVLLSTTYPNTESDWVRNQPLTVNELYKIQEKYGYTGVADMTKMHENLLATGKRYRDMTGNNVNHPNDFLARIYAQVILKTLIG